KGLGRAVGAGRCRDHQAVRVVVVDQHGIDTVGQPALVAYLFEQPRGEAAAAENVVHQERGEELRVVAGNAGIGELQGGLRQVVGDADLLVELGLDVLDRDQLGLFRQSAEHLVEVALQRLGIDGANHADDQVGTGKKTLVQ